MMAAFAIAFLSIWAAAVATRVLIFRAKHTDPDVLELLDDHLVIQRDLLFWKLWRLRNKVEKQHRWKVVVYFLANVTGITAGLVGVAAYLWLKH